jgi:hypothetical protein
MPLVQTRGAASAQGFGEFAQAAPAANYIEDVFSTYLYTGTSANQTITNNTNLSGKGGMVWIKDRTTAGNHALFDTARGALKHLSSNDTAAQITYTDTLTSFNSNGFSLGADTGFVIVNYLGQNYCSWTFREQPKFFDVVTYTGNGTARTIAHNLGSAPGMIIIKSTSQTSDWQVYHRSIGASSRLVLNATTESINIGAACWNSTDPTSTVFSLGTNSNLNTSGQTYVAYLFAHDAGGFGTAGTDNVISCGSYTGTGAAGNAITLGYEPQYLMLKRTDSIGSWQVIDNMRAFPVGSDDARLSPNLADAEVTQSSFAPTATGFVSKSATFNGSGHTYIYMTIRRPMKVPTSGTQVFNTNLETTTANPQTLTTGFPVDLSINTLRNSGQPRYVVDRLRGSRTNLALLLNTDSTAAEASYTSFGLGFDNNTGIVDSGFWNLTDAVFWNFSRRTGFFDIVCYTGTGTLTTQAHNLGVTPEMMIIKRRNNSSSWFVYSSTGIDTGKTYPYPRLNGDEDGWFGTGAINATAPTSSVFTVNSILNDSAAPFVAYLFATCPGVSKVGSYTGTGATQTINCGFTGGARWVLIKRTDSTGSWWLWDTARGMVAGTDPRMPLNSQTAEANNNWVYTVSTGFQIVTTDATVNASGGTFIFLAVS